MARKITFTDTEQAAISAAITKLEKATSGEVVPVVTKRSDLYPEVGLRLGYLMGGLGLVMIALLSWLWLLPAQYDPFTLSMAVIALMLFGYYLPVLFPFMLRYVASKDRMEEEVLQAAKEAFLDYQLFETKKRIGILIYVSLLEHKIIVLGDSGINAVIDEGEWDSVVAVVANKVKSGDISAGLVDGIHQCETILLHHGFNDDGSGRNELANEVIVH